MSSIFGPVPSRRLGRSLGIDVIPKKTCSFDCIYCESGRTTHLSLERKAFIDPDVVLGELEAFFKIHPEGADVLTFSSAGEPTLYEPLGELISGIKGRFPTIPLIVLTNGSLLWDGSVRKGLLLADRVVPSLDAASEEAFRRVNRPHPGLELSTLFEGLRAFRLEYRGELHMEVMIVSGENDSARELSSIRRELDRINPDAIELNTVVRPPAYHSARGLSAGRMREMLAFFPSDRSTVIGTFTPSSTAVGSEAIGDRVRELVRRRPCTVPEMEASLGVTTRELSDALTDLENRGLVARYRFEGQDFVTSGRKDG